VVCFAPEWFRYNAEHCTAIETKPSNIEKSDHVITKFHPAVEMVSAHVAKLRTRLIEHASGVRCGWCDGRADRKFAPCLFPCHFVETVLWA